MKDKRGFSGKHIIICAVSAFLLGVVLTAMTAWFLLGRGGFTLAMAARLIDSRFVAAYDQEAMVDSALDAMVESLGDRWSYYLTPEEREENKKRGENLYTGAGFTYTRENGEAKMLVVALVEDGPAAKAGLQVGDKVVGLFGQRLTEENFDEVVNVSWGEVGSEVSMVVENEKGEERQLTLILELVERDPIRAEMLEGDLGYVAIENFHHKCADKLKEAVDGLTAEGAKGLIFDVRRNPGGFVSELTEVLDYLLPEGPIFTETSRRGRTQVTESDESCVDLPMVVLVDEHSYSAAELFAAQLRESAGAGLVGQVTSGKGYYQVVFDLPNGGGLGLSIGHYGTGSGRSLIGEGLTPDILEDDWDTQTVRAKALLREEIAAAAGNAG